MIEQYISQLTWFLLFLQGFNAGLVILMIGKARQPITPGAALFTLAVNIFIGMIVVALARDFAVRYGDDLLETVWKDGKFVKYLGFDEVRRNTGLVA